MSSFLERILADCQRELAAAVARQPLAVLQRACAELPPARDFAAVLRQPGLTLVAEVKRVSPARGVLKAAVDPVAQAVAYVRGGAAAISVLTERHHFHGALEDLRAVRAALPTTPLLRKDFLLDPYQVWEARAAGADAVLVIVAIVDDSHLRALLAAAAEAGVAALVEVHTEEEVQRALAAGATIIGINNRNLRTFTVDLATTERLRPRIPPDRLVLSLSAVSSRADVERLAACRVDGILVGEALMRAADPERAAAELVAWGAEAALAGPSAGC
jgi:indole-3-glycerol phosphate synthase